MELRLDGKRALVTGASSGLGQHFAGVLAEAGATVTLASRRVERVEEHANALCKRGYAAKATQLDVSDPGSVSRLFAGATPFDIVVNNAGIANASPALNTSTEDFNAVLNTNLSGVFSVAREAAAGMKDNGGGSIINIASILGLRVSGGVASYTASKAAVIQLSKALALEWARYGVRVNALCPGYIETPINAAFFETDAGQALIKRVPQRRLGQPTDLDAPLLLLASDQSSFMTGSVLAVDGGHLVSGL
ncbi:MAG: glucose 1-dehydrogenase [Boseongicola sp.]|nr:glucose 1-dehydrogenase [Boseongicola sp.]MDD9977052.1 glucose 1-dehydrogenase [Boseongicola sp.]